MKAPKVVTIDFETKGIEDRPLYPPVPVGVSIKAAGAKPRYLAWGHPTKNSTTLKEAKKVLQEYWRSKTPLLFHHAKFDVDVAQTHMGCGAIDWRRVHDTQFLLFLDDPHALSLSLKPSAERLLDLPPEERDAVKEWVLANVPEAKKKPSSWGAHIWRSPGDLVGKYANGDVLRTEKLFNLLYPRIEAAGMLPAYDRERALMPILLENERIGLRVDVKALQRDIPLYEREQVRAEAWLLKKLGVKELNFDSDIELADALDAAGIVAAWTYTKTGKKSTSKQVMTADKFKDKKVFLALGYRNRLTTCLSIFMRPWLEKAERSGGVINPNWNQVRQPKGEGGSKGTRTGRPSCDNPNLLNLAKSFEQRGDEYTHPTFIKDLKPLPLVRQYILPDEGCAWLHRDYNQQELRILAHFEDGAILQAYKDNPEMDIHTFVKEEILRISHKDVDRVSVKTMNFGRVYGQGLGSLAEKLKVPVEEVKAIRDAQNTALPGLPQLDKDIKALAAAGEPIITWGGRVYYVEPPAYSEKFGRQMTFEYKMLNYLIQGSAADATKEAVLRFYYHKKRKKTWRFLVTVYDEINICAPVAEKEEAMKLLKECMEGLEFDVALLTDGKIGSTWGTLEKVKKNAAKNNVVELQSVQSVQQVSRKRKV